MMYSNPFIQKIEKLASDNQVVLIKGNEKISAKELFDNSRKLASGLQKLGMTEHDISFIATVPGLQFLELIFATMLLRSKVAIIDPEMGRDNYEAKIQQLQPKWAFIDYRLLLLQEHPIIRTLYLRTRKNAFYIPYSKKYNTITTGGYLPIFQRHFSQKKLIKKSEAPTISYEKNEVDFDYIITYTSGTIHEPKGVLHSVNTLYNSISHIISLLGDPSQQKIVTHLPHYMLIGVCAGIQVYIWEDQWSLQDKISFIEKKGITTLFLPPSDLMLLLNACKKSNRKMPKCLKHIMLGSAPVHAAFLEKLMPFLDENTRVTCMYGMTENLIISTIDGREKIDYPTQGDVLGKPLPGVRIKSSADGELLVSSNQLFKRYLHKSTREEWHHTGDMGYLDENGYIILTGRKKDMLIRRNFNIYPALYEPTIKKIKGISEAVLVGVYDEKIADEIVYLCIEMENDFDNYPKKNLLNLLHRGKYSIDVDAIPDEIEFCPIPRTGRQNKIDRNKLRKQLKEKHHDSNE